MDNRKKQHIAMHAPNLLNLCIDGYEEGEMSGRVYHCYSTEAVPFAHIISLIELMEHFYDELDFPQASEQARVFKKTKLREKAELKKVAAAQETAAHRGALGSFLIHVKYRQHSSWQGEAEWVEGEMVQKFASVLELLKILNNALEEG